MILGLSLWHWVILMQTFIIIAQAIRLGLLERAVRRLTERRTHIIIEIPDTIDTSKSHSRPLDAPKTPTIHESRWL